MSNLPAGFEVLDEMSWDDEIEEEGGFILLPEGDYDFEVVNLERGRFGGSEKMQACPKATLDIRVKTGDGKQATIKHTLFLLRSREWLLTEFFTSIGQRKKNERIKPDWNAVIGGKGRCKVGTRKYRKDSNSEEYVYNDIKKFYEPETKTQYKAGVF